MAGKKEQFRTSIGGQALIEGIMMRGPDKTVCAARALDGSIAMREEPTPKTPKFFKIPIIRGTVGLIQSLSAGYSALNWSMQFYPDDSSKEEKKNKLEVEMKETNEKTGLEDDTDIKETSSVGDKVAFGVAIILSFAISIGLFTVLPTFLAGKMGLEGFPRNAFETLLRLIILLAYICIVFTTKDMKRTAKYHGAEHKSIACYEAKEELTIENIRKYTRFHPRCGTSFLLTVVIVSLLVFMLASAIFSSYFDWNNMFVRVACRLLLLPLVVGISYEFNRWAGRHENIFSKILRMPGLWLQKFTTAEPDDSMLLVAIAALTAAIPEEKGKDEWGREN